MYDGRIFSLPPPRTRPRPTPVEQKAGVLVTDAQGRFLLVQCYGSGRYTLPKGSVEQGEEVHAAARRELREETGVRLPLDALAPPRHGTAVPVVRHHNCLTVYRAGLPEGESSDAWTAERLTAQGIDLEVSVIGWYPAATVRRPDFALTHATKRAFSALGIPTAPHAPD